MKFREDLILRMKVARLQARPTAIGILESRKLVDPWDMWIASCLRNIEPIELRAFTRREISSLLGADFLP